MRIAVVGPGALGSLLAASCARLSGHEVWLLDHRPERARQLACTGIIYEESGSRQRVRLWVTASAADIACADLVLLCVKSYSVSESLDHIKPLLCDSTILVTFQNGIGHLPVLRTKLPDRFPWAIGVTSQGATLVAPGHVRHGGQGLTRIGWAKPVADADDGRLEEVASLLTKAGFATEVEGDIMRHVWMKLLVNVGINALTALLDCPNGALLESSEAMARQEAAVKEAVAVAAALGIAFEEEPLATTRQICRDTADNISSMLQDVRSRRRTEIDAINGAVVQEARRLGIHVPENERLVAEIRSIEQSY